VAAGFRQRPAPQQEDDRVVGLAGIQADADEVIRSRTVRAKAVSTVPRQTSAGPAVPGRS
jgi:hypothetical protein